MISRFLAGVALAALVAASTALADEPGKTADAGSITFHAEMLYPESMSWSAKHSVFFVGSVRTGAIGTVDPGGKFRSFSTDDKLVSTVGILVDDARDRVIVANADPGAGTRTDPASVGKLAGVAVYDMTSGKRIAYYDLGGLSKGAHLANDMALDAGGNIYVTDSFAPIVYKIDGVGHASILARDDRFHSADGFNLNGIAYHPDGFLLVGKYNTGELFKVSLGDGKVEPVALPSPIIGADGFNMVSPDKLLVAMNAGADKTIELVSTDGWHSAGIGREVPSIRSMPTAVTRVGGDFWVLNSRLDTLLNPKAAKVSDYLLQKL